MQKMTEKSTDLGEELKKHAQIKNDYSGRIKVREMPQQPCFSGENKLRENEITVSFNGSYPLHKLNRKNPLRKALGAVLDHEVYHVSDSKGEGCPRTETLGLEKVLTPIAKVLKSKGILNVPIGTQGHSTYTYFANLFTDFVDNNIGSRNGNSEGLCLLYDDQAQHGGGFGDLFEAFIKLQAMTFPHKEGIMLLSRHFKNEKKPIDAVKKYLERTKIMDLPGDERVRYLSNPDNWELLSRIFAEEFSGLLDLSNLQTSYFPLFGLNDFSRLNDETTQMEIAMKAYKNSSGKFTPPEYLQENLALLSVYRQLARKLEIKVESHSVETERPVAHVSRRRFDFEKDDIGRIEFGLDRRGRIEPQIGKYPLKVVSRYQVSAGTFPEIRIGLLDCSNSTRFTQLKPNGIVMNPWAPSEKQWTDASIYHHELLAFEGLCELFRRRGTLKDSNIGLVVFSDETRMAKNLRESEELALKPEFQNTYLDISSIQKIFNGQDSLVYTFSDGEVQNWSSSANYNGKEYPAINEIFLKLAKKHHFFHLQIGRETQMYRDIKDAGLTAVLDDGRNAAPILIDLTQKQIFGGNN